MNAALDPAFIRAQRWQAQQLGAPRFKGPAALLGWLGPVQAQDRPASLWALAARLPRATPADLESAVAARRIVRHWVPRGTLHWCAAADLRWLLALLAPRLVQRSQPRLKQLGITARDQARSQAALRRALGRGRVLARPEALAVMEAAGVSTRGQRGYHLLQLAGFAGVLCFGPMQGKQPGFVGLDAWLPKARALSKAQALERLARLYFRGRGPAGLADFRAWSGLDAADAKAALALARPRLREGGAAGRELYWAPGPAPKPAGSALLPSFDEWLLAYRDRAAVLEPRHAGKVAPGANGLFHPIVVLDGRVRGTWRRNSKSGAVALTGFQALTPAERARLAPSLKRLAAFQGED